MRVASLASGFSLGADNHASLISLEHGCLSAFLSLAAARFFWNGGRASDNLLGSVPVGTEDADFFEQRIRPLLMKECLQCHGEEKQEGGLRLDSRLSIIEGGSSGPAVDLVQVAESLLLKVVSGGI